MPPEKQSFLPGNTLEVPPTGARPSSPYLRTGTF